MCCFILAIGLLGWVAWELYGTNVMADARQDAAVEEFESARADAPVMDAVPEESASGATPPDDGVPSVELSYGEAFGVLRIPRFGDDYARPMFEATDGPTLEKGIGHYTGTAGPCQTGNFAIASHRTTYGGAFRDVEQLQVGDEITVETHVVSCTYVVERYRIVDPSETSVLAPVPGQLGAQPDEAYLTITTCHPMYSAAERYIVHARLVEESVEH